MALNDAMRFELHFLDTGQESTSKPDKRYPRGIDLDLAGKRAPTCVTPLPYPAPRVGKYVLHCMLCGQRVLITVAGRPDDPRSCRLACNILQ
jgi:hypothetical protein